MRALSAGLGKELERRVLTLSKRVRLFQILDKGSPNAVTKASLNEGFMESFMVLNIIVFADMTRRKKYGVSWDVRGVSSP